MQYSPKLKMAMEEIKAVLKKHDIGAFCVLHTPGHSEYLMEITPSYSCAKIESSGNLRIRAKLNEDFGGDKKKWEKSIQDTSNMFHLLSHTGENLTLMLNGISNELDKAANASHFGDGHTTNTTQNN